MCTRHPFYGQKAKRSKVARKACTGKEKASERTNSRTVGSTESGPPAESIIRENEREQRAPSTASERGL
ncbi:hypothetical protein BV20DRAFT_965049, partial [Pilatotrama ljubarskyi]